MSDNLDKRLEKASNEQSGHNMVAVVEDRNNRRIYRIEYKIPTIIGFIASSVKYYEEFCNTKLPFGEILNEVGKRLGIEYLPHYLLDDKSRKHIFEQLEKPKYPSSDYKISDIVELFGFMAAQSVLVKNNKECLEKGKEKEVMVEILLNYLKPDIGYREDYKDSIFYRIRAYKL
jgi:hypothetical protein